MTASPEKDIPRAQSLITVYSAPSTQFTLTESPDKIVLQTSALTATMTLATGAVSFTDKNGRLLLAERPRKIARPCNPPAFEGQPSYGITQTFEATEGDAYYGLGQHQDDVFNYQGRQVFLFRTIPKWPCHSW